MAPSSLLWDVWSSTEKNISVDVLMPNGLLLTIDTNRDATLNEIKEDVWEAAQHHPLYGLLHDMDSYVFVCVNQTTAEQEEQLNEQRCLCDVRPFQAILRLVEKKGEKAEKVLNSQIRFLIGKGLHEFDAQKNPEINDFRWKMRLFCEEITRQREGDSLLAKMLGQYPVEIDERATLPKYLLEKLHEGNIVLSIRMVHNNAESTSRFCVPYTINAKELMELVLSKKAHSTGLGMDYSNYLLKICGFEEFLIGPYSLGQYKYVQEMIASEKNPELLLVPADSIQLDDEAVYVAMEKTERKRSRSFHDSVAPGRRKQTTISAWTVDEPFTVHVNYIHRLNCENNTKVAVEAGLFYGDELLCEPQTSTDETVEEGECQWEEELKFDLTVCNIPRMARLCFCVFEVSRTVKSNRSRKCQENRQEFYANPITWVNTTVYDFKHILKTGPVTLHMWPFGQDIDVDVMLNPLGGVVCNPNMEQAAVLTVSFPKYHSFSPLSYPSLEKIMECSEALQAQNNNSVACGTRQASKTYLEQLRLICDRDSLYQLHEQEKELMWFLREACCYQLPHSLPKLLRCVKWNDHRDVAQMISLLQIWPRIPAVKALELLDYAYPDQAVRTFAVDCLKDISDEELSLYLLQLVQAVKHESYLQCDLVEFLLRRSLRHRHNGHRFFWLLRSEMKYPEVSIRFGLILEAYCRGATEHIKSLSRQVEALSKLKLANELIQTEGNRRKEGREKLKLLMQELLSQNYYQDMFIGLQNPLDPKCRLGKLRVEKCKFLDSKMKPLYLAFDNIDGYGKDVFIIFKNGDDLRQDMLTLQMIRIMDKMWKDEGLDFRMIPYRCLATDYKVGLIEVVTNADTIANIQKEKGFTATSAFKKGSLLSWLKDHNSDEKSLGKAIEEFTLSCAGYCVATYVLGVADRHSDNIMVKTNGQLFHIDFGHILGKFKEKFGIKRERVPFVLTHDFVYIITKGHTQKSEEFNRFQQYCEQAFTILRRKGPLMISLFAMMLSTGIPELTCEKDLDYLRETLVLGMTEQEALRHFQSKFDEALRNSWKTSVNWLAHNWAKDNKMNA